MADHSFSSFIEIIKIYFRDCSQVLLYLFHMLLCPLLQFLIIQEPAFVIKKGMFFLAAIIVKMPGFIHLPMGVRTIKHQYMFPVKYLVFSVQLIHIMQG